MDRTQEMKRLRFEEMWSLEKIAIKYGISRERVRQIIGNSGYIAREHTHRVFAENSHLTNSALSRLLGLRNRSLYHYRNGERHEIEGGNAKAGSEAEIIVSRKLFSLGIRNKLMPHMHRFDILLETGKTVDVKSSNPVHFSTLSQMYNFNTGIYRKGAYCDFLILLLRDAQEFFIVPIKEAKGIIRFCWPKSDFGRKSKWVKYHNRFDLLKG